jgi:lipoprotein-releasing system ATP-binding protein
MIPRIEARGLERTLEEAAKPVALVRDVSFAAAAGEFVAILGPSGCGKSSLLYLLGLLDRPSAGEIWIEGQPTSRLTRKQQTAMRLEKIGFVFQFHFLLPEFSALENVALPMRRLGRLNGAAIEARAALLLASLGVGEHAAKRPDKLSGGERQRVAIARALANDPALLLCDEPTGNLDTGNSEIVVAALRRLTREEGRTIICVTHDERVAAEADRRIRMRDARVVEDDRGRGRMV